MKFSDYYNFELDMRTYFNAGYSDKAPQLKYRGEYLSEGWYNKYQTKGNSITLIPKNNFLIPGRKYLKWIIDGDKEFITYLYELYISIISLVKKMEDMNFQDISDNKIINKNDFYDEYIEVFSKVISFGYPLDTALEEYATQKNIQIDKINIPGRSFAQQEEQDLAKIFLEKDLQLQKQKILEHSKRYSYIFNNYSGFHPVPLSFFTDRLGKIEMEEQKEITIKQPESIEEWIGFSTYIRDVRKQCNMIYSGLMDRYLQRECSKLKLNYEDAVLLTPEEFESKKDVGLPSFGGIRYLKGTHSGLVEMAQDEWDALISSEESGHVIGLVASKGKFTGTVKIILSPKEFDKFNDKDILVTSMTRPEFVPIMKKAGAVITNEGGITCHAAIISRELKIPCIIATGNATKILKDGDTIEVDANNGIIRIIN